MRRVDFKKVQPGDLVQVPGVQYDVRQGLNGYIYREAVVLEKGRGKKSGNLVIRVEMANPVRGKNAYKTVSRIFKAQYVFQSKAVGTAKRILKCDGIQNADEIPAYLDGDVVGAEWIRFLYDKGFLTTEVLTEDNAKCGS